MFVFLLEHKSTPDKFVGLQVSEYIINFWKRYLRESDKIPIVVPIVFYHGVEPWNYETDLRRFISNYELAPIEFKEGLPALTYKLIDLRTQDEQFIKLYEPLTRLIIRSFKYIYYDNDQLIEIFISSVYELKNNITAEELHYFVRSLLLYYANGNKGFTKEKLIQKINESDKRSEQIMTIIDEFKKEGLEEGLRQGRQEGLREGLQEGLREGIEMTAKKLLSIGMDIEIVAEGTGLSIGEVREMKAKINEKSD